MFRTTGISHILIKVCLFDNFLFINNAYERKKCHEETTQKNYMQIQWEKG